jgi:hypothetical protein
MVVSYIHPSAILYGASKCFLLGVKKVKISLQSPKKEFGLQNHYGHVVHPSIGNFVRLKKKYTFGGQKGEKKPSEPINGIWAPKSLGRVIHPSIGNFIWSKKMFPFGGQKGENKPSEPINGICAPKSLGRVIHPSIGNFIWSKKMFPFGCQKGENKPSEPKKGIWAPKSLWSCRTSIDQKFCKVKEKIYF